MILDYVTLHLKPTPAQQAGLDQLLAQLQDRNSPNYHKWLTPEQYAGRFGASAADLAQISAWLEGQGLTVISQARGRNFLVFKGTVAAVERALRVEIHRFLVDGEVHFANSTEPSVPAAIRPFTIGFTGLDDFRPKPLSQPGKPAAISGGQRVLAPIDLWKIYDVSPMYTAGITGKGMKIAVVGQSDVDLADIAAYQTDADLPVNPPTKIQVPGTPNRGITKDSAEADLDLEMVDAIARDAQILFVSSGGAADSAQYVIDQNLAPVMTFSYGYCEGFYPFASTFEQLAQQASALGITWVTSSGDTGAAECDSGSIASHATSVDLPASVPEVTGVGGTEFITGRAAESYWAADGTAASYIPEVAWNDTNIGQLFASGGGASAYFSRPAWQTGLGVPATNVRYVPDVAMAASPFFDPYFYVAGGVPTTIGGTSAATPVFAGIVLLADELLGGNGSGNINPFLYTLASIPGRTCDPTAVTPGCVFHDVSLGNNFVPCVAGVIGCVNGSMGFLAGAGYDMVTGLGSVDAAEFVIAAIGPAIVSVTTAYAGAAIAQNTFIVIAGFNLVPVTTQATGAIWSTAPSFAQGEMPTQLGDVSVTVNNKPAFVYFYCSAITDSACPKDQLNILTPLDDTVGPVSVVVTSAGVASAPFTVNMQRVAPSFLLFNSGYIAATHADYSLVGPTTLYPGYSTPAKPGEVLELYAIGFGLPSSGLVNGSSSQSGSLPAYPVCSVGGTAATLSFAGLISPGLYQLNLQIPASAANGDNQVVCSYGGASTPPGDLIAVQP